MPLKRQFRRRVMIAIAIAVVFPALIAAMMTPALYRGNASGANLSLALLWLPVVGTTAVIALTWWVLRPALNEMRRVREVVAQVRARIPKEFDGTDFLSSMHPLRNPRTTLFWLAGIASAAGIAVILRQSSPAAPLWAPLALVTILAQLDPRQSLSERTRWLIACSFLLYIMGGKGRQWLDQTEGAILFGLVLAGLLVWHFTRTRRMESSMQLLLGRAMYRQAIVEADRSASPIAPALRAYAQFRLSEFENARKGLRLAIALATNSEKASFALAKLGEVLLAEGRPKEAIIPLYAALELTPEEVRAHRVLAQLSLEHPAILMGALRHAQRAVEVWPEAAPSLAVLAWALAESGQVAAALETVPKAKMHMTGRSDVAEAHYFLGRAYEVIGHPEGAKAGFETVRSVEPEGLYRNIAERSLNAILLAESTAAQKPVANQMVQLINEVGTAKGGEPSYPQLAHGPVNASLHVSEQK